MEGSEFGEQLKRTSSVPCSHDPVRKGLGSTGSVVAFSETFSQNPLDFFYQYFSDEEDYFTRYHSKLEGFSEVQPSEWQASEEGCCLTRLVRFRVQIYNPIGSDSTMVSQVQRCKCVGTEVVYSTRSTIHDIPFSSSFVCDSIWRISPSQTQSGKSDVQINAYLSWTGGSLLRGFVSNLALEGMYSYHSHWLASVKELEEEGGGIGEGEEAYSLLSHSTSVARVAKQPPTREVVRKKFRSEMVQNSGLIIVRGFVALCLIVCFVLLLCEWASTSSVRHLIDDQKAVHSKLQQELRFVYTYLSDNGVVSMDAISEMRPHWKQREGLFESLRLLKEKATQLQEKHSAIQHQIEHAAAFLRQDS